MFICVFESLDHESWLNGIYVVDGESNPIQINYVEANSKQSVGKFPHFPRHFVIIFVNDFGNWARNTYSPN